MAITLTLAEFAAAIRAGDGTNEPTGAERIAINGSFEAVKAIISQIAPDAPDAILNEAVVRAGGYLYDAPEGQSGDFIVRSGAASLLKRWTTRRLAGLEESAPSGGLTQSQESEVQSLIAQAVADFTDLASVQALVSRSLHQRSIYSYLVKPPLVVVNVTSDQAIANSGDGYKVALVTDYAGPPGIVPGVDFVTEWEGVLSFEISDNANVEITLRTIHKFGTPEKELVHTRSYFIDASRNTPVTLAMADFFSRSTPIAGTFRGVTVTDAEIRGTSKITYELEIRAYNRRSETTRKAVNLKSLVSQNVETASYQLGFVQPEGHGSIPEIPLTEAQPPAFMSEELRVSEGISVQNVEGGADPSSIALTNYNVHTVENPDGRGNYGFILNTESGSTVAVYFYLLIPNDQPEDIAVWVNGMREVFDSLSGEHVAGYRTYESDGRIRGPLSGSKIVVTFPGE